MSVDEIQLRFNDKKERNKNERTLQTQYRNSVASN